MNKCKARLASKGFHHQFGFNFKETFSLIVRHVTIQFILTLAITPKWEFQKIDINNAFLNGSMNEDSCMVQPLGFEKHDPSLV